MRSFFIVIVIVGLSMGCGGGGKSGGAGASGTIPQQPLATTTVDQNGGRITVNDPASSYDGASVDIPSGALTQPTTVTINALSNTSPIIGALPVDFGPNGTTFAAPVTVTIPYTDTLVQTYDEDPADLLVFSRRPNGEFEVHDVTAIDPVRRRVTATTTHFSAKEAKFSRLYLLFDQPRRFFDGTPAPYKITVRNVITPSGRFVQYYPVTVRTAIAATIPLGKGTVADFWKGGQRNLLLIHGLQSSPPTFLFSDDPVRVHKDGLLWSLRNEPAFNLYDNIILYQYPSGITIAENAQWLSDTVKQNAHPGFKTDIIAHSMGGIVARCAIERFNLSPYIERLITLGSPHEGGQLNSFTTFIADTKITMNNVERYIPGLSDIIAGRPFLADPQTGLNAQFTFSKITPTEYYLVVGKKTPTSDNDGLVKETSAAPPYLVATPNHTATFTNVEHSELHTKAKTNGVLMKIREWVTGQPNRAPIVNAGTDQAVIVNTQVTLTGSATDPDLDAITYAWTQTAGSTATLSSTTTVTTTFTPTQTGAYTFQIAANDTATTGTDTVTITVNPLPPVVPGIQTFTPTRDTHNSSDAAYNANNPTRDQYNRLPAGDTTSGVSFWAEITFASVPTTIPRNATIVTATLALEAITSVTPLGAVFSLGNGSSSLQNFSAAPPITIDVTAYIQSQVQQGASCFFAINGASLFDYGEFYASEDTQGRGPRLTVEWR